MSSTGILTYEQAVDHLDSNQSNGHFESSDFLPLPDEEYLNEQLKTVSQQANALLNHLVHWNGVPPGDRKRWPDRLQQTLQELLDSKLIIPVSDDNYTVPLEVIFTDEGPGRRWDQLSGFFHRAPESIRDEFTEIYADVLGKGDTQSFPECVFNHSLDDVDRNFLLDHFSDRPWIASDDFDAFPFSIDDLPDRIRDADNSLFRALGNGIIFPVWNQEGIIERFYCSDRFQNEILDKTQTESELTEGPADHEWEREPFDPVEQIKALLIVGDALPFRSTQDGYPHLFDLKEAEHKTGWDRSYIHSLFHVLREEQLVDHDEERFYLTERVESWLESTGSSFMEYSLLPVPDEVEPDNCKYSWGPDFSFGRVVRSVLEILDENNEGMDRSILIRQLVLDSNLIGYHSARLNVPSSDDELDQKARSILQFLFQLGLIDRYEESDEKIRIRINERGKEFLSGTVPDRGSSDDLPVILQPDGKLMIPLDAPFDYFLRVNPFVLITGIDQMVEYKIDRQGLVQALNKGWDAGGVRDFLDERASGIPEPVMDLFDDVLEDVEEVRIEPVYHLLEFDNEGTAARALNALSNYNPTMVEDKKLLLRKKTTEQTIRRNLARGGIRLQSARKRGDRSPVVELQETDTEGD